MKSNAKRLAVRGVVKRLGRDERISITHADDDRDWLQLRLFLPQSLKLLRTTLPGFSQFPCTS